LNRSSFHDRVASVPPTDPAAEGRGSDATALLRAAGLRVTAPRVAVIGVVRDHPHVDAGTVVGTTRERAGWISVQGVYDVLATLTDAGVLRRVQPARSPARYEMELGDNHHHLACRTCGGLRDVPCPVGAAPCLAPGEAEGFVVDEAEIVFWGTCARCRDTAPQ
jgi:Fur family transcriptional regulator, stress-responsive regulator